MTAPLFKKITFIGLGLIGSSLSRSIVKHGLAERLAVYDHSEAAQETIKELGLVDEICGTMEDAVRDADLVIICTPLSAYKDVAAGIAPHLKEGAIISDVGSVKATIFKDVAPLLSNHVHLVPGHPIAGTEHSGPENGFAALFEGRWSILTPAPQTDKDALAKITALWEGVGAMVELMEASHHDKVLAITSHLPHMIAYTIVDTATDLERNLKKEVIKFSASGFRDFTRIAASNPIMWRDICLANKEAILEMLGRFDEDLTSLRRALRRDDGDLLMDTFTRTREIRRKVIEAKQDAPPEKPES
jgi:cyclohexadieny/prephenate dehydrogenase